MKKTKKPTKPKKTAGTQEVVATARRVPTQERSKARLERILDAADSVFAEGGFHAATMEQIAEAAETSIGSVYQFFPNKSALFDALCTRYLERAQLLFEGLLSSLPPSLAWPALIDEVIDAFWSFHVDSPGFRAVWVQQNISPELLAASDVVNRAIAIRSEQVMASFAPEVPPPRRSAAAAVVVETISAILFVAVRRGDSEASALVAELKAMVRAYLASVIAASTDKS